MYAKGVKRLGKWLGHVTNVRVKSVQYESKFLHTPVEWKQDYVDAYMTLSVFLYPNNDEQLDVLADAIPDDEVVTKATELFLDTFKQDVGSQFPDYHLNYTDITFDDLEVEGDCVIVVFDFYAYLESNKSTTAQ
jgi:hypothetical protein